MLPSELSRCSSTAASPRRSRGRGCVGWRFPRIIARRSSATATRARCFVAPPWPEIFETDAERRHSFDDAMREYPQTLAAYRDCGYELIEIPRAPVSERVEFMLRRMP
jgi:predicted ATPase